MTPGSQRTSALHPRPPTDHDAHGRPRYPGSTCPPPRDLRSVYSLVSWVMGTARVSRVSTHHAHREKKSDLLDVNKPIQNLVQRQRLTQNNSFSFNIRLPITPPMPPNIFIHNPKHIHFFFQQLHSKGKSETLRLTYTCTCLPFGGTKPRHCTHVQRAPFVIAS